MAAPMRIVFPYIGHLHQVPHSLPIAIELARAHPHTDVRVAVASAAHESFVQQLLRDYAPDVALRVERLRLDPVSQLRRARGLGPWKQALLLANRGYLAGFDAIVTPERTSLFLRRIGLRAPRMIWTRHGAGDREVGFARDVHRFDYVLMAGPRIEQRLLAGGLIRPGVYCTGVYAKFDWLRPQQRAAPPLFDNGRPTVLYNPHFAPRLSSWPALGMRVLEQFAQSSRYNLVFAPHLRLFDPLTTASYKPFDRYLGLPHVRIDLGSTRAIDMSYTRAADLYLGDVSSQVVEFLHRPRPCLFLDAHGVDWEQDPSYAFWKLGAVSRSADQIEAQVDRALAEHPQYAVAQQRYFQDSFELPADQPSSVRAAQAIMEFLRRSPARPSSAAPSLVLGNR
jgi:hypothetical protein